MHDAYECMLNTFSVHVLVHGRRPGAGCTCVCRREVNRGGLSMLYEILLEISGPEVKCALEVSVQSSSIATYGRLLSISGMYKNSVFAMLCL